MEDVIPTVGIKGFFCPKDLAFGLLPDGHTCLIANLSSIQLTKKPNTSHRQRYKQDGDPVDITRLIFLHQSNNDIVQTQWLINHLMGHQVVVLGSLVQPKIHYCKLGVGKWDDNHYSAQQKIEKLPIVRARFPALLVHTLSLFAEDPAYRKNQKNNFITISAQGITVHKGAPTTIHIRDRCALPHNISTCERWLFAHKQAPSQYFRIKNALKKASKFKLALNNKRHFTDFVNKCELTAYTALQYHSGFEYLPNCNAPDYEFKVIYQNNHPYNFDQYPQLLKAVKSPAVPDAVSNKDGYVKLKKNKTLEDIDMARALSEARSKRLLDAQKEITRCRKKGIQPSKKALLLIAKLRIEQAIRNQNKVKDDLYDWDGTQQEDRLSAWKTLPREELKAIELSCRNKAHRPAYRHRD